jgi:hypothetical protein
MASGADERGNLLNGDAVMAYDPREKFTQPADGIVVVADGPTDDEIREVLSRIAASEDEAAVWLRLMRAWSCASGSGSVLIGTPPDGSRAGLAVRRPSAAFSASPARS